MYLAVSSINCYMTLQLVLLHKSDDAPDFLQVNDCGLNSRLEHNHVSPVYILKEIK